MATCSFHREAEPQSTAPTLIEGLPGHGLVATIAVGQINDQLGLQRYGGIRSTNVPPVLSFRDGRVQDTVRVYSGSDPDILTLEGDIMLPGEAYREFSECVLRDLADEISGGVFLAASPAESEDQHGEVIGVATDDSVAADLEDAGITLAEGDGLVGGITGALVDECYQRAVPAALILVRADPHLPDPAAAKIVIDRAIEPLIGVEVATDELTEKANQIQKRKEQIAAHVRASGESEPSAQATQMYQ